MRLSVLTCTHNRHEAFALCERWMAAQTIKPHQWIVLDDSDTPVACTMGQDYHYLPEFRGKGSMAKKVKHALQNNLITGDALVFWEDDDWQSPKYLKWCADNLVRFSLIGEGDNLYYNVRDRWWFAHGNKTHASLCATAVRRDAFPTLLREVQNNDDPFIDSRLWNHCRLPKRVFDPKQTGRLSVGIKAMPGAKGYGSGHDRTSGWAIKDPTMAKLRELIGDDAAAYEQFYDAPPAPKVIPQPSGTPTIEVHIVTFNEELILPYTLRHYKTFATRIIVHDGGSTDRTLAICAEFGVDVEPWDTAGKINDVLLRELKEKAWLQSTCDWAIMVDADELLYFPSGVARTLAIYDRLCVPVGKPRGFEMESPTLPAGDGQIYDEIKRGAPDDRWYAKPILISTKRVASIQYSAGAHECTAVLKSGRKIPNPRVFINPVIYLLHYHHIGSVERIGAKYDGNKARFSDENKKHGWGWHGVGLVHAKQKRDAILAKIQQVIP